MHNSATQGLHLAIDLGGRTRLGPDAEWLPEGAKPPFDYEVDPRRAEHFYREVRRYWPGLREGALQPAYSAARKAESSGKHVFAGLRAGRTGRSGPRPGS